METLRHWKRVLPPFRSRFGRASRFSIGDLLAAGILKRLTDRGMHVGRLGELSREIVALCNSASWTGFVNNALVIDLLNGTCRLDDDPRLSERPSDVTLLCPLNPIMTELRDALRRSNPNADQHILFFPPVEVERTAHARRRAT